MICPGGRIPRGPHPLRGGEWGEGRDSGRGNGSEWDIKQISEIN